MTSQQPDVQWYIARDGKQHGPLSDVEMRTFVAHGHLKPTDLIWRPGFADWRPAPAVFPFQAPEPPAAPPRPADTRRPQTAPSRQPASGAERTFEPSRIRVAQPAPEKQPMRLGRVIGLAVFLLLLAGGGGWYVLHKANSIKASKSETTDASPGSSAPAPSQTADNGTPTAAPQPEDPATAAAVQQDAEKLDTEFQKTQLWTLVKHEFPDWYGEQLREVAKLTVDNQPQEAITKHLAEALVALRRQHASEALSASTEKLKLIASAFLENLKKLGERGAGACYGFISRGETAPVVIELMQQPDQNAAIQGQIQAIFEAIADGRKSPTMHEKAGKADYDVLVQQLAKLGWKENDLQVFSDPKALARESPARVCQMVQDWFVAHMSVPDQSTQERLLVETLKPVVSG